MVLQKLAQCAPFSGYVENIHTCSIDAHPLAGPGAAYMATPLLALNALLSQSIKKRTRNVSSS